jgi:N-acetylglucosamine-6-sulfatase
MRRSMRRLCFASLCLFVLAAGTSGSAKAQPEMRIEVASTSAPPSLEVRRASPRPNIVIVLTDDQAWSTFSRRLMPTVFSQLVDHGALFTRGYVETSECCPSRAELLTGLHEHHTRVVYNTTPLRKPTFVASLHAMGYRTMLAGKYLNSWPCTPRPEFDRWVCSGSGRSNYTLVNPLLNLNGTWARVRGYTTDILAHRVSRFVANTPDGRPFFVLYSPTSPHLPANDHRYDSMDIPAYRPASYDVLSTGPTYMRRGPLTDIQRAGIDDQYRRMSRAVRALDDSVKIVLDSLGARASNTLVVYLSDNGYLYGEHRRWGKTVPYEESYRVPFVVRYPRLVDPDRPFRSHALVQTVDVAATVRALLGTSWRLDGRSLVPLLRHTETGIRDAALMEHCMGSLFLCPAKKVGDDLQLQPPGFLGLVTPKWKYVEYATGAQELYDLWRDPGEKRNLARNAGTAALRRRLGRRIRELMSASPL